MTHPHPAFTPFTLPSGMVLPNRVAMLPLTRARAEVDGTPTALMAQYYEQRAGAGLIVSEACAVSAVGRPFLTSPGLYTHEHAVAWRAVTRAVHVAGGRIVLQINHAGRVNNLQHTARPVPPIAPSAVPISRRARTITVNIPRVTPYAVPRELPADEVALVVGDYRRATELAVWAGFDGVEVHADSGYLIHQFLSTNVNLRSDRYGGSPENRCRFALEVVDAAVSVAGPEFVGVKLTPGSPVQDIEENDVEEKYPYLVDQLGERGRLAFLHLYSARFFEVPLLTELARRYRGPVLGEASRPLEDYIPLLENGTFDIVGYGRAYIANPDLAERLRRGLPLSTPDPDTTYTPGPAGYTDYPAWDDTDPDASVCRTAGEVPTASGVASGLARTGSSVG